MFIEDEMLIVKELQSCENQRKGLYVPNKQGKQAPKKVQFLQVQKEKKKTKNPWNTATELLFELIELLTVSLLWCP